MEARERGGCSYLTPTTEEKDQESKLETEDTLRGKAEWDRGLPEPGRSLLIWLVCLAIKPQRHTYLTSNVLQ